MSTGQAGPRIPGATAKHIHEWWQRLGIDTSLTISPRRYLKISGELLFLTFSVSWLVSAFKAPKGYLKDNPIFDRIGYNNICVGFDTYPANAIALPGFVTSIYFAVRFLFLDMERAFLEHNSGRISRGQFFFSIFANFLYVFVLIQVPYWLMIPPGKDSPGPQYGNAWWHLAVFLEVIWGRWFPIMANFAEVPTWTRGERIFLYFYSFISFALPWMYIADYIYYDKYYDYPEHADPPLIPPWFLQTFDLMWFLCLALTSKFLPRAPDVKVSYHLIIPDPDSMDNEAEKAKEDDLEAGKQHSSTNTKEDARGEAETMEHTELTAVRSKKQDLLREPTDAEISPP